MSPGHPRASFGSLCKSLGSGYTHNSLCVTNIGGRTSINIDLAQTSAKLDDKKADETDTLAERPRSLQPPALQLCAPTTLQHCAPTTLQATNAARKQRQHYRQTITYKYVRD